MERRHGLRPESAVPLYVQLSEAIRRQIVSGRYSEGEQLPTEKELCERYSVSMITVRQAVLKLAAEGLVYRRRGKGTFVAAPKLNRDISTIYSFSADMVRLGLTPTSRVLDCRVTAAGAGHGALGLARADDRVTLIVRLRLAGGAPLLLENTRIPLAVAPDLASRDLSSRSLYSVLREDYGVVIESAVESYESVILDAEEARLLRCAPNSAAFRIERFAYDAADTAVELTNSLTRADRCKFSVRWGRKWLEVQRELDVKVRKGGVLR